MSTRVRVARVGVDRLVLLEPLAHRAPVQPDQVPQLRQRGLGILQRSRRASAGRLDVEDLRVAAAGECSVRPTGDQLGPDIGRRQVVDRVMRPLPDEDRVDGVGDYLAGQIGTHSFAARLDLYATRCLGHSDLLS
jgi:hypothetical protein